MKLEIGQEVYYVPSDNRNNPYISTIAKISTKWVYLSPEWHGRFNKKTMSMDGGAYTSPGVVYHSRDDYESKVAVDAYWKKTLGRFVLCNTRPSHVTIDDIDVICNILTPPKAEGETC